ncbi:MAG TPA: hypothetical protein VK041_05025 [Opitutales bacterium]|nr:hypothetical protein [Opitutales bacterium]
MTSEKEMHCPAGKRVLAFFLVLAMLFAAVASVDGGLHQLAHGKVECSPDNATCIISLLGAGAVKTAPTDLVVPLPAAPLVFSVKTADLTSSIRHVISQANVRAPPHFLIPV